MVLIRRQAIVDSNLAALKSTKWPAVPLVVFVWAGGGPGFALHRP